MSRKLPTNLDLGGVELGNELHRTTKAWLIYGHLGRRPVVVKILDTRESLWRRTFANEISIYRTFAEVPPPVRVPQMLHTDGHQVLVLERLVGHPVVDKRYPSVPLPDTTLGHVLETVRSFAQWAPPPNLLPPSAFDYHDRIVRYHERGWFDTADRMVLEQLETETSLPNTVQHGDPLLPNLVLERSGCVLLDFEFTGRYLPGWDLALLHTLLADVPGAQERVLAHRPAELGDPAWILNRALVLARERRIHHELPKTTPGRRERLESLDVAWQRLRGELHEK